MYLTSYIKSLIVSLTILILTTLVSVNSQAETCTTNDLGDRTCTTTTAGTTTGNVLTNSTFGTGSTYSTSGWTISGDVGHGHTSTTDALWAGVPVVSMLGLRMGSRVAVALLRASRAPHTEAMSHRDYEDLCVAVLHGSEGDAPRNLCIVFALCDCSRAVYLATTPGALAAARQALETHRIDAPLFDTPGWAHNFTRSLRSMVELCRSTKDAAGGRCSTHHVVPLQR